MQWDQLVCRWRAKDIFSDVEQLGEDEGDHLLLVQAGQEHVAVLHHAVLEQVWGLVYQDFVLQHRRQSVKMPCEPSELFK